MIGVRFLVVDLVGAGASFRCRRSCWFALVRLLALPFHPRVAGSLWTASLRFFAFAFAGRVAGPLWSASAVLAFALLALRLLRHRSLRRNYLSRWFPVVRLASFLLPLFGSPVPFGPRRSGRIHASSSLVRVPSARFALACSRFILARDVSRTWNRRRILRAFDFLLLCVLGLASSGLRLPHVAFSVVSWPPWRLLRPSC